MKLRILYISMVLLVGCTQNNYDQLILDDWDNEITGVGSITLNDISNYKDSSSVRGVKKRDIHSLRVMADSREDMPEIDFNKTAEEYPNILSIKRVPVIKEVDFTLFTELRRYYATSVSQNDLNSLFKCKKLMKVDFDFFCESKGVDSIPSYIGNLQRLTHFNTLGNVLFEKSSQSRPDRWLIYALDTSTTSTFYNPNYKTEHTLRGPLWLPEFPESFGELPLKTLRMSGNTSSNLPACVGNLKDLEELYLIGNNFDSGLEHIAKLSNLKTLVLDLGGSDGELPDDIFNNLENLEELNITWEYLPKLPSSMSKLKNLKKLKILFCYEITEIPEEVEVLFPQLEYLEILGCTHIPNQVIDRRN